MRNACVCLAAAVAACCLVAGAPAAWTEADWTAFDYQYDMSVALGAADADSNFYPDFGTTLEPLDGILTISEGQYVVSRDATALWPSTIAPMGFTTGYTYEFRARVLSESAAAGAISYFIGPGDSSEQSYITVGASSVKWGGSLSPINGSENTDDFHTFRVAQQAGESGFYVWRDGELIGYKLGPGYIEAPADFWFGCGGAGQGVTEIDYFAVTFGAVAPIGGAPADPPEMPGHVDGGPVIAGGTVPYAWYRADEGVVNWEEMNQAVYWADQSGNDRHLTAVGTPELATNSGGSQVVYLDGSGDRFESDKAAWGVAQPGTVFAVFRADPNAYYVYDAYHDEERQALALEGSDPRRIMPVGCVFTPPTGWDNRITYIAPEDTGREDFIDEIMVTSTSHTTGGADTFNINGETIFTGDLQSNGMAGLRLGGYVIPTRRYFQGDICELIVFEGELSTAERAAIEAELMARWQGGSVELEGDLNGDGSVNSGDLDIVRGNWGQSVSGSAQGDANADGTVNSADLDIVRANWGRMAAAAVPEPGIALLLAVGILAGLFRRNRGL